MKGRVFFLADQQRWSSGPLTRRCVCSRNIGHIDVVMGAKSVGCDRHVKQLAIEEGAAPWGVVAVQC